MSTQPSSSCSCQRPFVVVYWPPIRCCPRTSPTPRSLPCVLTPPLHPLPLLLLLLPVALPLGGQDSRQQLWNKAKLTYRYIYEHHLDQFDWFFKGDTDT